jgi:hypothetical protein
VYLVFLSLDLTPVQKSFFDVGGAPIEASVREFKQRSAAVTSPGRFGGAAEMPGVKSMSDRERVERYTWGLAKNTPCFVS